MFTEYHAVNNLTLVYKTMYHRSVAVVLLAHVMLSDCLVPQPFLMEFTEDAYFLPFNLEVATNVPQCLILDTAVQRFLSELQMKHPIANKKIQTTAQLELMVINVSTSCDERGGKKLIPSESMNEKYSVDVEKGAIMVFAREVWGALHALTSVSQLIVSTEYYVRVIPGVHIVDEPRFSFRSYLIDSSRHFLKLDKIFQFLDAMSTAKMNVLHWHIVDDHSFPFVSNTFPELAAKGSFSSATAVYSAADVQAVIEFARLRGIRVIPEFDTPGHTLSWGKGYPSLLTKCYVKDKPTDEVGPVDPSKKTSYEFLQALFTEILQTFPDNSLHLGGDEVDFACWRSNPDITEFMAEMQFGTDYAKLESFYIANLLSEIHSIKEVVKPYVWQEVFDNLNTSLQKNVTVHVWIEQNWRDEMNKITAAGYEVIYSACWYLNYISYGEDWTAFYHCDPSEFTTNATRLALLKGGGAAMWGEYVDNTNLISRSWPRGAVVAERLWSPKTVKDVQAFRPRLREYRCRLIAQVNIFHALSRGLDAEPVVGPGYCNMN